MKLTKTLSAAIAATTIVGAIGFAVAQTTDTTTVAPTAPETTAPANSTMSDAAAPAVTPAAPLPETAAPAPDAAAPASSDMSSTAEPAPKADRN